MKELTLKRRLNTYLYVFGTKQLEAQLENGVAYKKNVYQITGPNKREGWGSQEKN